MKTEAGEFNPTYKVGDRLWIMHNNRPLEILVCQVDIKQYMITAMDKPYQIGTTIHYEFAKYDNIYESVRVSSGNSYEPDVLKFLFKTRNELIASIL